MIVAGGGDGGDGVRAHTSTKYYPCYDTCIQFPQSTAPTKINTSRSTKSCACHEVFASRSTSTSTRQNATFAGDFLRCLKANHMSTSHGSSHLPLGRVKPTGLCCRFSAHILMHTIIRCYRSTMSPRPLSIRIVSKIATYGGWSWKFGLVMPLARSPVGTRMLKAWRTCMA